MRNSLKSLSFLALVTLLVMGALAYHHTLWAARIATNARAHEHRAILRAVGIDADALEPAEVERLFASRFRRIAPGRLEYSSGTGTLSCYAIHARGLWGPIEGWLVLEPDGRTIRAVAITRQEETPGLGSEIASSRFLSRLSGRPIVYPDGSVLTIVKAGTARRPNEVDGISGATLTTRGFSRGLGVTIRRILGGTDGSGH